MAVSRVAGIIIEGSSSFISRTSQALILVIRAPSFATVRSYIGKIAESARSGMRAYADPPTYEVGRATSTSNVFWYASTIAHDSYHSKLYHDAALRHRRVPASAWTGPAAERACNEFQIRILRELRSLNPAVVDHYITYLQGIISSGRNYYSDYGSRSW